MPATTLADRAILRLSGEDVRGFLNGLVTQDVGGELPVWAGLLTPQGKCLFDFLVFADGDDLLLDVAAGDAEPLLKRLAMYRLRRKIILGRDDSLTAHWSPTGGEGADDPRLAALGRRWIAEPDDPAEGWLGHRLALGVCEGDELKDLLWLECNAVELHGVSFSKGCFVGQENTARMNWRQKVNRRLFVVERDGGDKQRAWYPHLGLAVIHARIDAVPADALMPDWLAEALKPTS